MSFSMQGNGSTQKFHATAGHCNATSGLSESGTGAMLRHHSLTPAYRLVRNSYRSTGSFKSDAALIDVPDGLASNMIVLNSGQNAVIWGKRVAVVGLWVCKTGATTGQSCASITRTDDVITGPPQEQDMIRVNNMVADGGDSGSPLYATAWSENGFYAVDIVGSVHTKNSNDIWASKISNIELDMQATLISWYQTYQLRVRHSGQCLNIEGATSANGARIIQYPCVGAWNENWQFMPYWGSWSVQNPSSFGCVTLKGGSTAALTPLDQYWCSWNPYPDNQSFNFFVQTGRFFLIYSPKAQQCWDVPGASLAASTQVDIYPCVPSAYNHQWELAFSAL
jgi:hypothetical protein